MNRLLERLVRQYTEITGSYDLVIERCSTEGRDPTEAERAMLDGMSAELGPLGERIQELRLVEDRRAATMAAVGPLGELPADPTPAPGTPTGATGTPMVRVKADELVYRRDGGPDGSVSFFRDLVYAREGDQAAIERQQRHSVQVRALGTSTTGGGALPPVWIPEEFAVIAHGPRPIADSLRRIGITDARPINVGQATSGAVVGAQAAEGNPPSDGAFVAAPIVMTPGTYTGKVDISRQLLDGSSPAVDTILYGDLMGAYAEQIESMVVAALATLAGGTNAGTFPLTGPTVPIPSGVIDAGNAVRTKRKAPPRAVYCSYGCWGKATKQVDTAGRPLIVQGSHNPMNAFGVGDAVQYGAISGDMAGLPVIPSWAMAADTLYVCKSDDFLLFESSTMNFRYEEVLGPESIRLGVWGYAGCQPNRYPLAMAVVTLTGYTSLEAQEADTTEPEPEHGNGEHRSRK